MKFGSSPSLKGLFASGSGLVGDKGGPTWPHSKDRAPPESVFMATYLRRPLPKSQMMYHWLFVGMTARLSSFIVQTSLFVLGVAGSNGSAINSSRISRAGTGGLASPAGSLTRLTPGRLHGSKGGKTAGVTSPHVSPSPMPLTALTL